MSKKATVWFFLVVFLPMLVVVPFDESSMPPFKAKLQSEGYLLLTAALALVSGLHLRQRKVTVLGAVFSVVLLGLMVRQASGKDSVPAGFVGLAIKDGRPTDKPFEGDYTPDWSWDDVVHFHKHPLTQTVRVWNDAEPAVTAEFSVRWRYESLDTAYFAFEKKANTEDVRRLLRGLLETEIRQVLDGSRETRLATEERSFANCAKELKARGIVLEDLALKLLSVK